MKNDELLSNGLREIFDAKYEAIVPSDVVKQQDHMNSDQKKYFHKVLDKYANVFNVGTREEYPDFEVKLHLIDGAQPVFQKSYSVPQAYVCQFNKELYHLVEVGVFAPCKPSHWAFPTFVIPKKNVRIK